MGSFLPNKIISKSASNNCANPLNFIDLFCGCGGFTLGMERAGFKCLAAIDFNVEAVATLQANLSHIKHVLHRDLTAFGPDELSELIGVNNVDVIVGGPPCQGFSTARKVGGANHGERLNDDPRRHLYLVLLKYVAFFRPKVFVMENVLGIKTAAGGEYFTRVQSEARALGYRVHGQVEDAWELGVPQKRRRQLIVGTRADIPGYFSPNLRPSPRALPRTLLGAAIGDLPPLRAGEGENECDYDFNRMVKHLEHDGDPAYKYLFDVLEIDRAKKLTNHVARPHSERDLRDFALINEGESSAVAMRNGVEFEFPYDKSNFKDRYTRQSRSGACSTIVAHLSKDGLMFIHPTQNRSLTPREAARIQSFPDWFRFHDARTHSFRMIGNAVPPLISEAVGRAVISFLEKENFMSDEINQNCFKDIPKDENEALQWLVPLLDLDSRAYRRVSKDDFFRGWTSVLFLYSGLHPDGALERGSISCETEDIPTVSRIEPRLLTPYYKTSGWPVVLVPIAEEAWRRFESGNFGEEELYCADAQIAGMHYRKPELFS
ncbi:MAG: DNA cytosine methyltransferase [Desulfuromonadaceae bacterium]